MKANEAPEKLYLFENPITETPDDRWLSKRSDENDIEYTRTDVLTDAFIEKVLKWYCLDCECNDNCKDTKCFFYREFERYLKGRTNALPPKISGRILGEDGSISDNWRYRHFTSKMQDAFIEKACSWLKETITNNPECNRIISKKGVITMGEIIKDFRKYMEE